MKNLNLIPTDKPSLIAKGEVEEAAERLAYDSTEENKGFPSMKRFIEGAKWQAERMYNETIEFGKWLDENTQQRDYYPMSAMTMEELFEQFKKK